MMDHGEDWIGTPYMYKIPVHNYKLYLLCNIAFPSHLCPLSLCASENPQSVVDFLRLSFISSTVFYK
jgi:hypothetical protein